MNKITLKKATALMLCLLLVCSLFGGMLRAEAAESAVQKARESVVRIYTGVWATNQNGQVAYIDGVGSGFFVGNSGDRAQYIVTNAHVVSVDSYVMDIRNSNPSMKNAELSNYTIVVLIDNEAYEVDYVNNVYLSRIADIAILKLNTPVSNRTPAALGDPDSVDVTDTVYAIGFPGYADQEDMPNNETDSMISTIVKSFPSRIENMSVTKGSVVKNHVTTEGIDHIQHDAAISGGNSGGPLVDENGAILGMNSWASISETATANYAIDVSNIKTFLKQNSIPFYEAAAKPSVPDFAADPAVTTVPASTTASAPAEEKTGISTGTVVGIGAAILAAAVVAVLMSRKKRDNSSSQAPVPTASAKPDEEVSHTVPAGKKAVPIVRSLAQQHGNRKIAIGSEAVLLGRSRECKIVYKEGTPGVSSKHCAITWDPEHMEFILKDMNSTYGTFLDSGMKLDPSRVYRLKPGESFYLGEKSNTVKLEIE